MRVVYTDAAWSRNGSGRPDPALATIEREVFGSDVDIELGLFTDRYVTAGDAFLDHVRGADALVIYRTQVTPERSSSPTAG
jgi:D-3-phosphoglycerate dehydrogenase